MKSAAMRMICRFLVATLMLMTFSAANAGMIGADQLSAGSAQADRAAVMTLLNRSEVASQLQAQGIDPHAARDRVNALSDQEVQALKGQIDALPAGAMSGWGWAAVVIVVAVVVWYLWR